MTLVVGLAAFLPFAAALGVLVGLSVSPRRLALRRRVVVNLRSGRAFQGVLWARRGGLLVLRDARLLEPGSDRPQPLDGEVVVERGQVDFVQVT